MFCYPTLTDQPLFYLQQPTLNLHLLFYTYNTEPYNLSLPSCCQLDIADARTLILTSSLPSLSSLPSSHINQVSLEEQ